MSLAASRARAEQVFVMRAVGMQSWSKIRDALGFKSVGAVQQAYKRYNERNPLPLPPPDGRSTNSPFHQLRGDGRAKVPARLDVGLGRLARHQYVFSRLHPPQPGRDREHVGFSSGIDLFNCRNADLQLLLLSAAWNSYHCRPTELDSLVHLPRNLIDREPAIHGGAPQNPVWVYNLRKNPDRAPIRDGVFFVARTSDGNVASLVRADGSVAGTVPVGPEPRPSDVG